MTARTIEWRDALKSTERITDTGGVIICGNQVCIWQPCEQRKAIAALQERAREQLAQERTAAGIDELCDAQEIMREEKDPRLG